MKPVNLFLSVIFFVISIIGTSCSFDHTLNSDYFERTDGETYFYKLSNVDHVYIYTRPNDSCKYVVIQDDRYRGYAAKDTVFIIRIAY